MRRKKRQSRREGFGSFVIVPDDGCAICEGKCPMDGSKLSPIWRGLRTCQRCGTTFTDRLHDHEVNGAPEAS